jgi:ribonuclease T1
MFSLHHRRHRWLPTFSFVALCLAFVFGAGASCARDASTRDRSQVQITKLPREAQSTLRLIKSNGPFPYQRDGSIFGNFEGRLPKKPRGYYKEYTVPTPGARDRGARRIIAGRDGEYFYTNDHYSTFRRIVE